jgi:hypothetical protein
MLFATVQSHTYIEVITGNGQESTHPSSGHQIHLDIASDSTTSSPDSTAKILPRLALPGNWIYRVWICG